MLGNHDYGTLKPTKSEKKKQKKMMKEAQKRKRKKKEEGDYDEEGDDDSNDDEEEELDSLPPPRPSRDECAAALGATSSSSPSSSPSPKSQQCSYGPLSQLGARLPQRDSRWRVSRAFQLRLRDPRDAATGGISLSGFDTTPLVEKYRREAWARVPGGVSGQRGAAEAGLLELGAALERERAAGTRWRLAVGHHPFASLASPLRTPELDSLLAEPLRHSSAVFAGHDHTLQFLRWPRAPEGQARPPVLISGGGSDVYGRDDVNASAVAPGSSFFAGDAGGGADAFFARRRGFADCVVTALELRCDLVSGDGEVLFSAVVPAGQQGAPQTSPPPPSPAAPDAAAAPSDAETAAATTTPPPRSPPAPDVVELEENGKPQAAEAEAQQQKQQEASAAAAAATGRASQQQQLRGEQQADAAPRPPPAPHLNRR